MDPNHDIVPTLRMFDGLMTGKAADEIERLRNEAMGRRESMDRLLRRARRRYFDNNPPNTWLATVFNELLQANGTFEQDQEAHAKREAAANGDTSGNRWWVAPCDRGQCPGPASPDCCHKPHPDDWMDEASA